MFVLYVYLLNKVRIRAERPVWSPFGETCWVSPKGKWRCRKGVFSYCSHVCGLQPNFWDKGQGHSALHYISSLPCLSFFFSFFFLSLRVFLSKSCKTISETVHQRGTDYSTFVFIAQKWSLETPVRKQLPNYFAFNMESLCASLLLQ